MKIDIPLNKETKPVITPLLKKKRLYQYVSM